MIQLPWTKFYLKFIVSNSNCQRKSHWWLPFQIRPKGQHTSELSLLKPAPSIPQLCIQSLVPARFESGRSENEASGFSLGLTLVASLQNSDTKR